MSFALTPSERGDARSLATAQPLRDSNSKFTDGNQKVQDAIKLIRQCTADIRTLGLGTAQNSTPIKLKAQETAKAVKISTDEAKKLLQQLAPNGYGSEQKMQRLTHQKMTENLAGAVSEFETSFKAFKAAEAKWDHSHAQMDQGSASSDARATDLEAGRFDAGHLGHQMQMTDAVAQAEVEMHTEIVDKYTEDVTKLASNMQGLQRALLDLADQTQMQGETIDNIEANMSQASSSSSSAVRQVEKTVQTQWKNSKRTCWMLFYILFMVAVILTVVKLTQ